MPAKPITPTEAASKRQQIPDAVIEAFNELIARNFRNGRATFYVKEVEDLAVSKWPSSTRKGLRQKMYDEHWLDVELLYRKAGWEVKYESPAMDESFDPHFTFISKRRYR